MAKAHQRAFALTIAIIFLLTVIVSGVAVVWQIIEDGKESEKQATTKTTQKEKKDMLQGTKLADFTPIEKVDELKVIDIEEGTGEEVKAGATVKAHYTGALASSGTIFQSSHDMGQPIEFPLDGVIPGWTQGVPGMKVGGKRRLIIPAAQAYGEQSPSPEIPPNSDLVFDIEIVSAQNK